MSVNELTPEKFIKLFQNMPAGSALNANADLSLQIEIENDDGTTSYYLGPSPDSMPWDEYADFMRACMTKEPE